MPHWGLIIGLLVQLYAVSCQGASSTDTTLSACDYAAENLYVVNASAAPGALFPTGYVQCANTTGSDQELCAVCSCREKKVASVAGVTVAWVVCVGSGDATTCASSAGSEQLFCGSSYSQDSSSSSSAGRSVNVGDSSSSSNSDVGDAGVSPSSRSFSSSSSADASVEVGSSSSFDTASSSVEASFSSDEEGTTLTPTESLTLSPEESHSEATNEDNVITNIAGTTEPSQTSAATASEEENIIRPSNSHGSTQLETNTGTSASSGWSGKRLTVIVSVMCGVAAIAAIAVFVAVRNDRARKRKKLGTPSGEFTDDGSSVATPVTSRLDGRYRRHGHSRHHGGSSARFDSSDNTPLASIVVLDVDDEFDAPAPRTQYRSREARGRKMSGAYVRSESVKAGEGSVRFDNSQPSAAVAGPAVFNASHGPSVSELRSPSHNPIFDTSNTQVSFSSSMSSQYDSPPSPRVYESEDIESDSYRQVSATYSDSSVRDSDASTIPRERYTTNDIAEEEDAALNTVVSFASSFSSLDSTEYELRSTEASEFMHDSELPSRSALSLDVGSMY